MNEFINKAEKLIRKHRNDPSISAKDFECILKEVFRMVGIQDESMARNAMVRLLDKEAETRSELYFKKGYISGWNNAVEDISMDIPDSICDTGMSIHKQKEIDYAFRENGGD